MTFKSQSKQWAQFYAGQNTKFYLDSYSLKAVANASLGARRTRAPMTNGNNDPTFEVNDKTNAVLDNFMHCFQRRILSETILALDPNPAAHGITHCCTMEINIKPKSKGHAGQFSIL
jgi:hypothetical protein